MKERKNGNIAKPLKIIASGTFSHGIKFRTERTLPWAQAQQLHRLMMMRLANFTLDCFLTLFKKCPWGFPGGAVVENLPDNAGDTGSSPGLGGSHMPRSN